MIKRRCLACHGSGVIVGGGMIKRNCPTCNGIGKVELPDDYQFEDREIEAIPEIIYKKKKSFTIPTNHNEDKVFAR